MRRIVYYVASSIDGFIAGPGGDISGFVTGGDGVEQYQRDLASFDTVIMGRHTYEFGYRYGLQPGQQAYPHMTHFIFSNGLAFERQHEKVHVRRPVRDAVVEIKRQEGSAIYLCGGGAFAGWLLEQELIDELKIKLNPVVLGGGVRLFGGSSKCFRLEFVSTASFERGLQIITYNVDYTTVPEV